MSRSAPALALLLPLLLILNGALACNVTTLLNALDITLATYERSLPPAQPQRVVVSFKLRHATVRRDSTVHVLGDLALTWTDPRLAWNETAWGCNSTMLASDRLWLPDVELANGAGGGEQPATSARVRSDGGVAWSVRHDAAVPVELDLTRWPVDVQTAEFKFAPRSLTNDDHLELEIMFKQDMLMFESGEWEPVSLDARPRRLGARPAAAFAVRLRRRAAAHAAAAGAVLAAAVLLLLTAAVLPPSARPPLCACASFISAIWLSSALARLPSSGSSPAALVALCGACAAGGAAGACAALAALLARRTDQPPPRLKAFVSAVSAHCRLAPTQESSAAGSGAWVALATLLDRVLVFALLVALLVLICIYI